MNHQIFDGFEASTSSAGGMAQKSLESGRRRVPMSIGTVEEQEGKGVAVHPRKLREMLLVAAPQDIHSLVSAMGNVDVGKCRRTRCLPEPGQPLTLFGFIRYGRRCR